jgi:hypothetical protein
LLDGRWVDLGAMLATWMTPDDIDHLEHEHQVKLYKDISLSVNLRFSEY